jgi:hypothetical protein
LNLTYLNHFIFLFQATKKQKASRKNSGKASLRSLIRRKIYRKEGQKEKILPVASKLLHTISIHYLDSNGCVLDGEATSSVDGSLHSSTLSKQDATNLDLQHANLTQWVVLIIIEVFKFP